MRVLVVIAHFYREQPQSIYSSTNGRLKERRRETLQRVLLQWKALSGADCTSVLDINTKSFVPIREKSFSLDLVVLLNRDNHLLDRAFAEQFGIRIKNVETEDTRMIPFAAHQVMKESVGRYDWYVYSEEDLLLHDQLFFQKQSLFQAQFGPKRVFQPHRYELNGRARFLKTYIDGDLRPGFIDPYLAQVPDAHSALTLTVVGQPVTFVRTKNPHSGFFTLSAEQLQYWVSQPSFMDLDCSFVGPLESAATLSLLKSFSLYKPTIEDMAFLEIQHLDNKFSSMMLPMAKTGLS
jgi:hypothetical protein